MMTDLATQPRLWSEEPDAPSGTASVHPAETALLRLAYDLGAAASGGLLSGLEDSLIRQASGLTPTRPAQIELAIAAIKAGGDPLGEALCQIRSPEERRGQEAFYTPADLVEPMVTWVMRHNPDVA